MNLGDGMGGVCAWVRLSVVYLPKALLSPKVFLGERKANCKDLGSNPIIVTSLLSDMKRIS